MLHSEDSGCCETSQRWRSMRRPDPRRAGERPSVVSRAGHDHSSGAALGDRLSVHKASAGSDGGEPDHSSRSLQQKNNSSASLRSNSPLRVAWSTLTTCTILPPPSAPFPSTLALSHSTSSPSLRNTTHFLSQNLSSLPPHDCPPRPHCTLTESRRRLPSSSAVERGAAPRARPGRRTRITHTRAGGHREGQIGGEGKAGGRKRGRGRCERWAALTLPSPPLRAG